MSAGHHERCSKKSGQTIVVVAKRADTPASCTSICTSSMRSRRRRRLRCCAKTACPSTCRADAGDHGPFDADHAGQQLQGPAVVGESAARQVVKMQENCPNSALICSVSTAHHRGIVHVIGPELGATQPGKTIVCGDSHTSTHGAFGALAFGIGTTEVGHVLATQCLLQRKAQNACLIDIDGSAARRDGAKTSSWRHRPDRRRRRHRARHRISWRRPFRAMDMEARMTVCNMSIEAGARAGMIAPDDTTIEYLAVATQPRRRRLGRSCRRWQCAAERCRAQTIDQDSIRRWRQPRTDGHLRHQPGHGRAVDAAGARRGDAEFQEIARLHAALTGQAVQRAALMSFSSAAAPTRVCPTCNRRPNPRGNKIAPASYAGGPRIAASQTRGGGDWAARRYSRRPAPNGVSRVLDVPRHERRHGAERASSASAPATGISRAARARAPAQCWRVR